MAGRTHFDLESKVIQVCFVFYVLCDWSRKLTPLYQPIRCKTKTSHAFSRAFGSLVVLTLRFHWLLKGIFLSSSSLLWLLLFWFYNTQSKALYDNFGFVLRHSIEICSFPIQLEHMFYNCDQSDWKKCPLIKNFFTSRRLSARKRIDIERKILIFCHLWEWKGFVSKELTKLCYLPCDGCPVNSSSQMVSLYLHLSSMGSTL